MPRRLPKETALFDDEGFNFPGIYGVFREQNAVFESFTEVERHGSYNRCCLCRRRVDFASWIGALGLLRWGRSRARQHGRQERGARSDSCMSYIRAEHSIPSKWQNLDAVTHADLDSMTSPVWHAIVKSTEKAARKLVTSSRRFPNGVSFSQVPERKPEDEPEHGIETQ